jgi:hypothetical protein
MAARFHYPPRTGRRRPETPAPRLALVPPALAPVVPIPRPHARPVPIRLVLLSCPVCDLATDPMPAAEAEQLAGGHDDQRHGGQPTAVLRTDPSTAYALGLAGDGPDHGGAA